MFQSMHAFPASLRLDGTKQSKVSELLHPECAAEYAVKSSDAML